MELKDSELDSLIEMSLSEDFIPSQELNLKLKQKLDKKSAFTLRYVFNAKTAVAAAAIVLVSVAAFRSVNVLDDLGQNTNIATNVQSGQKELTPVSSTSQNTSDVNEIGELQESVTSKTAKNEVIQKEQVQMNIQPEQESATVEQHQKSEEINEISDMVAVAEFSENVVATMDSFSQNTDHITITASEDLEVYNTLNDVANSYIESLINGYNASFDIAMASEAAMPKLRSMEVETTEEESKTSELTVDAEYDVLADSDKYYSIEVHTKINEEQQKSKMFTVDKEKSEIVTLDSLYNYDDNYKNELSQKINEQLGNDTEITVTGFENFYVNESAEVIISLAEGEFNVGKVN